MSKKNRKSPGTPELMSTGLEAAIGRRLRTLRKLKQRNLRDLADETGFSIGLISQIERGLSSPSVKHLMALGQSLGVSIYWFFDDTARLDPTESPLVVRREMRRHLSTDHGSVRKELLSPEGGDQQHRCFLITVEAGGHSGKGMYAHQGDVCGFVLSGALRLWIGKEEITLREGDSFAIPRDAERRFANPDAAAPTLLVWSIAYFGMSASIAASATQYRPKTTLSEI